MKNNKKVSLATVVQTWGSSPLEVGSRMIINENGNFFTQFSFSQIYEVGVSYGESNFIGDVGNTNFIRSSQQMMVMQNNQNSNYSTPH